MGIRKPVLPREVFPSPNAPPPRLIAVEKCRLVASGKAGKKKAKVRCKCSECGKIGDFWVYNLRNKHSRSCGCYQASVRANAYTHLQRYRAEKEPAWTMGRVRSPQILERFEIIDPRPNEAAIRQQDKIRVRCRKCGWRGKKGAVELERYPRSCQRCSGKEQWTLGKVREVIRGKRILLKDDKKSVDRTSGRQKVRLSDRRYFRCMNCDSVKPSTIMSAVRLKTRWCKKCKPDSQWLLGDFRDLVHDLGGKVIGLASEPDSHLIRARQKIEVQCPYGHTDRKHADHVTNQRTLCRECSTGLYERIVRAHFQAVFGVAFPKARPAWLRNPKTGRCLELDGYSQELSVAFEHDGPHHYGRSIHGIQDRKYFKKVARLDALKETLCLENGVALIRIPSLGDELPLRELRACILSRCKERGLRPKHPHADVEMTTTPDAVRILEEAREIVEARGGKLISTEYLGSQHPLAVRCSKGHNFRIRVSHLKDKQWRWCRKCYASRISQESAQSRGFSTYRDRIIAHLAVQNCCLLSPKKGNITAKTKLTIKCQCGSKRNTSGQGALVLKNHGLCRGCSQLLRSRGGQ